MPLVSGGEYAPSWASPCNKSATGINQLQKVIDYDDFLDSRTALIFGTIKSRHHTIICA